MVGSSARVIRTAWMIALFTPTLPVDEWQQSDPPTPPDARCDYPTATLENGPFLLAEKGVKGM